MIWMTVEYKYIVSVIRVRYSPPKQRVFHKNPTRAKLSSCRIWIGVRNSRYDNVIRLYCLNITAVNVVRRLWLQMQMILSQKMPLPRVWLRINGRAKMRTTVRKYANRLPCPWSNGVQSVLIHPYVSSIWTAPNSNLLTAVPCERESYQAHALSSLLNTESEKNENRQCQLG